MGTRGWIVLALVLFASPLSAQAPADLTAAPPPREGTLGSCTITLTGGQYWRSAIMMHSRGSPDGFGAMTISVGARITCTTDTQLRVAGAWAITEGARHAIHRPEHHVEPAQTAWDGHVTAGTPIEVSFTWQDGPTVPRGAEASAVVRFRAGTHTLELFAPSGTVAFVS